MPTLRLYWRYLATLVALALAAGGIAGLYVLGAFGGPDTRAFLPRPPIRMPSSAPRPMVPNPAYLSAKVLVPGVTVAFTDANADGPVDLYLVKPGVRKAVLLTDRKRMHSLEEVLGDLSFSRDGRWIAFTAHANTGRGEEPRTLWALNLATRKARALSPPGWDATPARWLLDGHILATVRNAGRSERLCLFDTHSGAYRFLPHPNDDDLMPWYVTADRRSVLFMSYRDGKTRLLRQPMVGSSAQEAAVLPAPAPPNAFRQMAVSPRGELAFTNGEQSLITDGAGRALAKYSGALFGLLWSPSGSKLLGIDSRNDVNEDGEEIPWGTNWIEVFDRKSRRFDRGLEHGFGIDWGHMDMLGWLPDGRTVVVRGYADSLSLWRLGAVEPNAALLDRAVLDVDWWPMSKR